MIKKVARLLALVKAYSLVSSCASHRALLMLLGSTPGPRSSLPLRGKALQDSSRLAAAKRRSIGVALRCFASCISPALARCPLVGAYAPTRATRSSQWVWVLVRLRPQLAPHSAYAPCCASPSASGSCGVPLAAACHASHDAAASLGVAASLGWRLAAQRREDRPRCGLKAAATRSASLAWRLAALSMLPRNPQRRSHMPDRSSPPRSGYGRMLTHRAVAGPRADRMKDTASTSSPRCCATHDVSMSRWFCGVKYASSASGLAVKDYAGLRPVCMSDASHCHLEVCCVQRSSSLHREVPGPFAPSGSIVHCGLPGPIQLHGDAA